MSNDKYRYLATKWRKSLERRGWHNIRKGVPIKLVVEFHIIYRGKLYSGRCVVGWLSSQDTYQPGTLAFMFRRRDQITEGVWRRARNVNGELGVVVRDFKI